MDVLPPRDVPCAGCTLCCRMGPIWLWPELGDNPRNFHFQRGTHPITGRPALFIPQHAGKCHYLGDDGCTIHDRLPIECAAFDCRDEYQRLPRAEQRRRIRAGLADKAVLARGRELLERGE